MINPYLFLMLSENGVRQNAIVGMLSVVGFATRSDRTTTSPAKAAFRS